MNLKRSLILLVFIITASFIFAAPAGGGPGGGTGAGTGGGAPHGGGAPAAGGGCWPPPCVPIDGGISILIAAGALYGGKKLYNKHKQSKTDL